MKAGLVFVLAVLAAGCGAPDDTPTPYERIASAATGGGIFGVRIFVDTFDGFCFDYDDTQGPAPWFAKLGIQDAYNIATCGSVSFADGAVLVAEYPVEGAAPKTAWMLHATAVSSNEDGYSSSNVNALDSFTVLTTGTNQAVVYLRIEAQGTVAGSQAFGIPLAEYEVFTNFVRILPDGYFEPFFSPFGAPIFRREDGSFSDTVELELPAVDSGTELLMSSGFLFALAVSDGTGVQGAAATAEFSLCSRDPKVTILSASGITGNCPADGDLRIASIKVIQSVADGDLVAGKDTVFQVDIESTFQNPVDVRVEFSIEQPNLGAPRTFTEVITVPPQCGGPTRFYFPGPIVSPLEACATSPTAGSLLDIGMEPRGDGLYTVKATLARVDDEPDTNPDNDIAASPLQVVKETSLLVSYVRVDCPTAGCYGTLSPDRYGEAIDWVNAVTPAMFPVTPATFFGIRCMNASRDCAVRGSTGKPAAEISHQLDIDAAFDIAVETDPLVRSVIAIAPNSYFAFHGASSVCGWTPIGPNAVKASVVSANPANCLPNESATHELMHQYQPFEVQKVDALAHPSTSPSGYWVRCPTVRRLISGVVGVSFSMDAFDCESPTDAVNLLAHSNSLVAPVWATGRWIDRLTYNLALEALKTDPDPEILYISGMISTTGKVDFGKWRNFPGGRIDHSRAPGEYAYRFLDTNGTLVFEETFPVVFLAITDSGVIPTTGAIISMRLPYSPEVVLVQFLKNGVVLAEHNPLVKTLRDGVESIPDRGFAARPGERRKALLNKVEAFEKMMAQKNGRGALEKLRHDIRPRVDEWMTKFVEESPLDFTEEEMISLIDRIATRIESQLP